MCKSLIELRSGERGEVVAFEGGHAACGRIENMGIRTGKVISRVSSQLMGGPVIVSVDGRQTAMGRGMAARIRVRVLNEADEDGRPQAVK